MSSKNKKAQNELRRKLEKKQFKKRKHQHDLRVRQLRKSRLPTKCKPGTTVRVGPNSGFDLKKFAGSGEDMRVTATSPSPSTPTSRPKSFREIWGIGIGKES